MLMYMSLDDIVPCVHVYWFPLVWIQMEGTNLHVKDLSIYEKMISNTDLSLLS